MSEVQETGTSRKIEHIEKSQSSSSKTRKLYVLGVAFVAVLLIGTSFGMMLSATTPSIPTVIEPGSGMSDSYYLIFASGGNYFVKNGTTGAISASGSNPSTVINNAITDTPEGRTIRIVGDITFTSPIILLRKVNLVFDGMLTASYTDWLYVGDATHFVKGAHITFNEITGVNQTKNCIVLKQATALTITFTKIQLFNVGIYFDPKAPGIGAGENSFYGGWITACNYGIDFNPTGDPLWAQGNRFYMSIYASDVAGIRISGLTACDMQLYYGTIDSLVAIDPDNPSYGGGRDIWDTKGGSDFYCVYAGNPNPGKSNIVAGGTFISNQTGMFQEYNSTAFQPNLSDSFTPVKFALKVYYMKIVDFAVHFYGAFSSENVDIAVTSSNALATTSPTVYYNNTVAPGTIHLSGSDFTVFWQGGNSINYLQLYPRTNATSSTNVLMSVTITYEL